MTKSAAKLGIGRAGPITELGAAEAHWLSSKSM
jgi:hypothetical protein